MSLLCSRLVHARRAGLRYANPRQFMSSYTLPTPRKLSEVTEVSKLSKEEPSKIELIWTAHHQGLPSACSALIRGGELVDKFQKRAQECPHFIFPVFNGENYYVMYSQFQKSHFMMTFLDDFKRDPSGAAPWFSVVLYPDLVEDKDLALVRGDFLPNIQKKEAEALLSMTMDAYLTEKPGSEFLRKFNLTPGEFNFEEYVRVCQDEYGSRFENVTGEQ